MRVFLRRGTWCVADNSGIQKFNSEEEALAYAGLEVPVEETLDAEEESETEDFEEEAGTDE